MRKKGWKRAVATVLTAVMMFSVVNVPAYVAKAESASSLVNGDFETDIWTNGGWTITPDSWDNFATGTIKTTETCNSGICAVGVWFANDNTSVTFSQTVSLEAGTYTLSGYAKTQDSDATIEFVNDGESTALSAGDGFKEFTGTIVIDEQMDYSVSIKITGTDNAWVVLDDVTLTKNEDTDNYDYKVSVTPSTTDVTEGDTITLTATVKDSDGNEVTDLESAGLYLWWWSDTSADNSHGDANTDAELSNYGDNKGRSLSVDVKVPTKGNYYIGARLQDSDYKDIATVKYTTIAAKETAQKTYTKDELQALIEKADEIAADIDNQGYTKASVTAFKTALANAKTCISDEGDYTSNYIALSEAISNLALSAAIYVKPIEGITEDTIRGMDVSSYISIMNSFDVMNEAAGETKYGFRDYNGNILTKQGFFDFLAAQGVNYIRLRVWNNPYDANGKGYGGGNNDVAKAIEMGKYATTARMKVLIDFHYSDFWADPGKQQAPKAWAEYSVDEKVEAISRFTTKSLQDMIDAGVNVTMVQVGNETNGKICGETAWDNMNKLFDAGCDAVHQVAKDNNTEILAAVHFTNPEKSGLQAGYAEKLDLYDDDGDGVKDGVTYDVFATSYYPYWHGSLDNLISVLSNIATTYNKKVMVAETSWANSLDDVDGHENTVREGNNDTGANNKWLFTVQGQASEYRDVLEAVVNVKDEEKQYGIGAFYWEGAWIGLQDVYGEDGNVDGDLLAANKTRWEAEGSGWASSYAAEYDSEDAGKWYGGSAVENQSFFDANGKALASLNVFNYNYLSTGANTEEALVEGYINDETPVIEVGDTLTTEILGTVTVRYNNGDEVSEEVNWNQSDIDDINTKAATNAGIGTYIVNGTLVSNPEYAVKCKVTVEPKNLVKNPSFENEIKENKKWKSWENWTLTESTAGTANVEGTDSKTGSGKVHFYNAAAFNFDVTQTISKDELKPGVYKAYVYAQGADAQVGLKIKIGNETYGDDKTMEGWMIWKQPQIKDIVITQAMIDAMSSEDVLTYTIHCTGEAGAWGTIDDAYLYWDADVELPTSITLKDGDNTIGPNAVKMATGDTKTLSVEYTPEDTNVSDVVWSTSDADVVTVEDGVITAVALGEATITATSKYDSKVETTCTIKVLPRQTTPALTIDYTNEKLAAQVDNKAYEYYCMNGDNKDVITLVNNLIPEKLIGKTLFIVAKGDNEYLDSEVQALAIPARPAAPKVSAVDETVKDKKDGQITGVTTAMEYKLKSASSWTACTEGTLTGLAAGEYQVRVKATATSFAGTAASVTVKTGVEMKQPGATGADTQTNSKYTVTSAGDTPTVEYTGTTSSSNKVVIPDTISINGVDYEVTSIKKNAFKNNKKITSVTIGNNVTKIDTGAFSGCKKLSKVTIGKDVTAIGKEAFKGCTSLTKVTIPSKVKSIGTGAFSGDTKLKTVTMNKAVTTIGDKAFYNCKKLSKITIPATVTKIGKQAFYKCSSLKSITIKTTKLSSKKVGSQAFKGINSKATIKVPKSKLSAYKRLLKSKGVSSKAKIKK